ncbi:hypothetical protein P5G51_006925 [Virgibacillus sp. 179-BFC.A HS]|uniref:Lipoprotein YvcA n=1 Tax=Tigheibacillus jepli TaxID=3035914 RepID=A0ABU5CFR6_9BACI|nr:hypothetical protein [Virgibacillus sp. 179-BFC.A HS]MDY0405171.1 hypothetical protein [Virgibacillus sp. 179-BFC.A HS]
MEKDISEMNPKDLPDVTAFQDDFTREFMASTEEVANGYYLFKSKTVGYTMWYPEDAKMSAAYYERDKNNYEAIDFSGENEKITGGPYYINAIYDDKHDTKNTDIYLGLLSDSLDYEGEYKKQDYKEKTVYFAKMKYTTKDKKSNTYRFFGLIKSKKHHRMISYVYNVKCNKKQSDSDFDLGAIGKEVKKVMENIEFNS